MPVVMCSVMLLQLCDRGSETMRMLWKSLLMYAKKLLLPTTGILMRRVQLKAMCAIEVVRISKACA